MGLSLAIIWSVVGHLVFPNRKRPPMASKTDSCPALAPQSYFGWLRRSGQLTRAVSVVAAIMFLGAPHAIAQAAVPQAAVPLGVWLIDAKAAVQIFDCSGLMCGRILWLYKPRDSQGALDEDKNNPDPALQKRNLCGLTILWNLRPDGPGHWSDGWFYNPDDGHTYRVKAELTSADVLTARIYSWISLFGKTKTLIRVPQGVSEGWC
jgi:uncharacterized protein (DUF2147 family)